MDDLLRSFRFEATTNSVAINILKHTFACMHFIGCMPRSRITRFHGRNISTLVDSAKWFSNKLETVFE